MTFQTLSGAWRFLRAFARARWGYRFADRAALERWQQRQIAWYLRDSLGAIEFYRGLPRETLGDLPVIDKAILLARFGALNRHSVALEAATAIGLQAESERDFRPMLPGGITVGLSSGTSGQRGVFLVSARERAIWAGTILARTLDSGSLRRALNPFAPRLKITLCLRANSNLYASVHSVRLKFQFCDLLQPMSQWLQQIGQQQPDILIAPASVLHGIADAQLAGSVHISPRQIVSVAEVLEADDAAAIVQAWGRSPTQVYQCTEGLLGQSCRAGSLHLNEEFLHIEPQWLDEAHERFTPLITDFTRTTQTFARYQLDDVLRVAPGACRCGKHTMRLAAVEGRRDDTLWLADRHGRQWHAVFPDVLRQMMVATTAAIADYRIEQHGGTWTVRLRVESATEGVQRQIATGIESLAARLGCRGPMLAFAPWSAPPAGAKRRRIECVARPADVSAGVA